MKLAIRQDNEAGLIRAYFSTIDDKERAEASTLSLRLARECPGAFDAWKEMLSLALKHVLTEMGITVVGFQSIKAHEKN
jgi:hypothetical protein